MITNDMEIIKNTQESIFNKDYNCLRDIEHGYIKTDEP